MYQVSHDMCMCHVSHMCQTIHVIICAMLAMLYHVSYVTKVLCQPGHVCVMSVMSVTSCKCTPQHWECKLIYTLLQYTFSANYMWIFVEGLYLHTLIFFAVFSKSRRFFSMYIIIGWGMIVMTCSNICSFIYVLEPSRCYNASDLLTNFLEEKI